MTVLQGPQPLPPSDPVSLPAFVPASTPTQYHQALSTTVASAKRTLEMSVRDGAVRPGHEDVPLQVEENILRVLWPIVERHDPGLVEARKALAFIDKKSEEGCQAITAIQNQSAVVRADVRKAVKCWVSDTIAKFAADYEALIIRRGADALVAVSTLAETVPVYEQAIALLEGIRASHTGASLSLAKVHPSIGRHDPRHAARQFGEALDLLKRARTPLGDIRTKLYPPEPKRGRPKKVPMPEAVAEAVAA